MRCAFSTRATPFSVPPVPLMLRVTWNSWSGDDGVPISSESGSPSSRYGRNEMSVAMKLSIVL